MKGIRSERTAGRPMRLWSGGIAAAVALVVAAASMLTAQEADPPELPNPPATDATGAPDPIPDDPNFQGIAGRIVEISDRTLVILDNSSQKRLTVRVPEDAEIKINRERAGFSHLKPGDQVRVTVAARASDLARQILVARLAPNPNPRPAPTPQPAEQQTETETTPARREADAGIGLVVTAGPNGGVLIVDAQVDSPAAKAGLMSGDLLVSFEGKELLTPQEYVTRVRDQRPGRKADVAIARGGQPIKGQVELARREAAPDVIIRRPAALTWQAAQFNNVSAVGAQPELEVSTNGDTTATAPGAVGVQTNQLAAGGDLQRIEQTLQVLLQEIRALRRDLNGQRGRTPRTPVVPRQPAPGNDNE